MSNCSSYNGRTCDRCGLAMIIDGAIQTLRECTGLAPNWAPLTEERKSEMLANPIPVEFALSFVQIEPQQVGHQAEYPFEMDAYDWKKPSLALVACDGHGHGCVLWTVGPHVEFDIRYNGLTDLADLGLSLAPSGLTVWEGVQVTRRERDLKGSFRKPSESEWAAIRENRNPWDVNAWRKASE